MFIILFMSVFLLKVILINDFSFSTSSIEWNGCTLDVVTMLFDRKDIFLIATWWQIMMKIFIKYQRNHTSMYLKPFVLGKSPLFAIDPNNVTSTSNAVTDVRLLFVRSSTSTRRVRNATNHNIKLGTIICIIPFNGRRFSLIVKMKALLDEHFSPPWESLYYRVFSLFEIMKFRENAIYQYHHQHRLCS